MSELHLLRKMHERVIFEVHFSFTCFCFAAMEGNVDASYRDNYKELMRKLCNAWRS